jgi:drug/metabolite transporter (DMT)-like permease
MITMIDWKRKLSSRKFWSLLLALIGAVLVAFNVPNGSVESIIAIIGAFASIITYILAEGIVDAANKDNSTD